MIKLIGTFITDYNNKADITVLIQDITNIAEVIPAMETDCKFKTNLPPFPLINS